MSTNENLKQVGLRINAEHERVSPGLVATALAIPVSVVGDSANRLQGFGAGFMNFGGKRKFAGPALTVRVRPGDNMMLHKALDLAQPGDVVVCDAGAGLNTAILGAMMATYAKTRGVVAIVIDGAIRDVDELAALDIAIVARGATPNGPFKTGPGEVGHPIACGGTSIAPGDLVIGDADGVLVLPRPEVAGILAMAQEKARTEEAWLKEILAGTWSRKWVDETLAKM
ncbi:MAG: Dimethylmenaquinone methyltransferase [Polaromonas sp.]|nr:Dimethylmenaquinone methyltransferase [Polaromonas sp.]